MRDCSTVPNAQGLLHFHLLRTLEVPAPERLPLVNRRS